MKKNFSRKKLDLNKQSIVNLNSVEMTGIQGGSFPITSPFNCPSQPLPTCDPCPDTLDTEPTNP